MGFPFLKGLDILPPGGERGPLSLIGSCVIKKGRDKMPREDGGKMKARRPLFLGIAVWAGFVLLGIPGPEPARAQGGGASMFQSYAKPLPLPDFSLDDLQGKLTHIKEFKGQVILLHFWATW